MADGSVKSGFRFAGFKVDAFEYQMLRNVAVLTLAQPLDLDAADFKFRMRQPIHIEKDRMYLIGIECAMSVFPEGADVSNREEAIVSVTCGIVGAFEVTGTAFTPDLEEKLVKFQLPTILLPYMRGTITNFLNNAGFALTPLPLFNIQEVAKQTLENMQIQRVSATPVGPSAD
jgi:hypothetical protein